MSKAICPFSAVSTSKPICCRSITAISRLIMLSSASSSRLPAKSAALSPASGISAFGTSSSAASRYFMRSTICVPLPGAVSTSMVPPIMSTMLFVIERPSPVPSVPLSVEVRSRSKALNMRSANSRDMPMPVSCTRIS